MHLFVCVSISVKRVCMKTCIVHVLTVHTFLHSILPPLAQDEFAWSNKEAALYVNIMIACITLLAAVMLVGTKYLVKW